MIKIYLKQVGWQRALTSVGESVACKGTALLENSKADISAIAQHFSKLRGLAELRERMQRLNGFYALVGQHGDQVFAAVDHVRSRPLFYGVTNGEFFLSDDAWWVREQAGDVRVDPVAQKEYLLTGYVTGADTLCPAVKQLQAGEALLAVKDEKGWAVQTARWHCFWHTEPAHYEESKLRAELDLSLVASIQRLIQYANGRKLVVPLSGGYDSRAIVTLLKRLGYDNVLTFTYGKPSNRESEYSRRVAMVLGFEWHYVEYNRTLWDAVWRSAARDEYSRVGCMLVSLPHWQDWLAVKLLKERGIVPTDSIFVPGHAGDMIAGGHIPPLAFSGDAVSAEHAVREIVNRHYCLVKNQQPAEATIAEWRGRVVQRGNVASIKNGVDLANACEKWNWQERQAKFICNSVRVYEYFGYDWWMPFWDIEYMRYWQEVPLVLRRGRLWYQSYVQEQYGRFAGNQGMKPLGNARATTAPNYRRMLGRFKAALLCSSLGRKTWYFILRGLGNAAEQPIYGMEMGRSLSEWRQLAATGHSFNGLLAKTTLDSTVARRPSLRTAQS